MAVGVFVTQQGVACRRFSRASSVRAPHARANGALTAFARPAASRSSVRSVAAGVAATEPGLTDAQRLALARELGYRTIGKDLPDHVSLGTVIGTIPAECFELDHGKAWRAVALTLTAMAASLALIAVSPWWFLPVAWFIAGTAFTGFFVIGHDAGHRAFHRNNLVEDIVGTIMFMPLIYPFEPWRIKHNHHHAHTNKLVEDTAWHPVMPEELEEMNRTLMGTLTKAFLGSPLKLWASIGHWWIWHFDIGLYTERQKPRVIISLIAVAAFALIGFPLMITYLGWGGWIKFWLMPWLGYHFWMSTFTVIHHTAPHIPFKPAESWNAAQAQLAGTVHCDFPRWVETLCHDINWHIPHHVNAKIPWYNLRAATDSLRENWGEYLTEGSVNWRMLKNIFTECHVYDEKDNYIAFDADREELFFAAQRRLMPNSM